MLWQLLQFREQGGGAFRAVEPGGIPAKRSQSAPGGVSCHLVVGVFSPIREREEAKALLTGAAEDERWHQCRNGERFWAVGRMVTLRLEDDGVRGFLKILQDRARERRRE